MGCRVTSAKLGKQSLRNIEPGQVEFGLLYYALVLLAKE
jgi:hypothetical protein